MDRLLHPLHVQRPAPAHTHTRMHINYVLAGVQWSLVFAIVRVKAINVIYVRKYVRIALSTYD